MSVGLWSYMSDWEQVTSVGGKNKNPYCLSLGTRHTTLGTLNSDQ